MKRRKKLYVVTAIDETEMMVVIGVYTSPLLARAESQKLPRHYVMVEISDHIPDQTYIPSRALQGRLNFTSQE